MPDRTEEDVLQDERLAKQSARLTALGDEIKQEKADAARPTTPPTPTPLEARLRALEAKLEELAPLRDLTEFVEAIRNHFQHSRTL